MRILGIKGKWFPQSEIAGALVCDHRFGAEASISISTDTHQNSSSAWGEALCFKHNLASTVFIDVNSTATADVLAIQNTGKIKHDLYFPTDQWENPNTGVVELIPDYYSDVWTAVGAAAFTNAVEGEAKTVRWPNHGQQLYDISNGNFGYDFDTEQAGLSQLSELINLSNSLKTEFLSKVNEYPKTFSYRNGRNDMKWLLRENFLGARNSGYRASGPSLTSYGFKKSNSNKLGEFFFSDAMILDNPDLGFTENHHLNRMSTFRFDSYPNSQSELIAYITKLVSGDAGSGIKDLCDSGGWFHDFSHWHSIKSLRSADYEEYLSTLSSLISGHFVYKSGYGNIVAYHCKRDSVKHLAVLENAEGFSIVIDKEKPYEHTNLNLISDTPVSVFVDLRGTEHENKEYVPSLNCLGIRKVQTGVFVVDLVNSCKILEHETGSYYDFSKPNITTSYASGTLTVNTDILTKCVIFETTDTLTGVTELFRDNELKKTRQFNIAYPKMLYLGVISKMSESVLIELNIQ